MPSPFPGMDPYLEDPAVWPSVHAKLIAEIQTVLNRVLRPRYAAVIEQRVYVSDDPDTDRPSRVPDVQVHEQNPTAAALPPAPRGIAEPAIIRTMPKTRFRELRLDVWEAGSKRVVTVIELLSPANKRAGGQGRVSFMKKKREVLESTANWVEIDLLRGGTRTFPRRGASPTPYAAHSSPVGLRPKGKVWSIPLQHPLPTIGIPLANNDLDAPLDLQQAFDAAYENGALDTLARYSRSPVPPLPPDLAAWADGLLREKGFR